ncbi:MAG TPA: hypothetical protein VLF20_03110 [Patescibacteria group bacterium]|nr:hypothetical protein [Patescibacteria group bacterium]
MKRQTAVMVMKIIGALSVFTGIIAIIFILFLSTNPQKYLNHKTPLPTSTPTPTAEPEHTVCTLDAKKCSDGSFVSRTGPRCEFAKCPGE